MDLHSDTQIFNRSNLREKIKDGTLEHIPPEPLMGGRAYLHYFFLGDNAFAFMPWMVKPYSRRQLTREEIIAHSRIFRGKRVVENVFGMLVRSFRVLLGTMEQRPKDVRDIIFTCVLLHNMLRARDGRADRAPTLQESFKGGQTSARPTERLFQSHGGHWLGRWRGSEMCQPNTLGAEEQPNYSNNFYLTGVAQIANKFQKKIQSISKLFQTKSQVHKDW